MVGKDGKRRVETSELLRVFDEINFNDSPTLAEPAEVVTPQPVAPAAGDPYVTARELTDLRGMIHDLKAELDDLREDNRRLLRLLEYQTVQTPPSSPPSTPEHAVATEPQEAEVNEGDVEEPVPVTSVAEQGWKAYRQQRAEQQQQSALTTTPAANPKAPSGVLGELGVWLKGFFLGETSGR